MTQYIPKAAIKTEIERIRNQEIQWMERQGYTEYHQGLRDGYNRILSSLDNIEAKEVNLDEEIRKEIDKYYDECEKKLYKMKDDDTDISFLQLDSFAKHFYELGLKAQKGE